MFGSGSGIKLEQSSKAHVCAIEYDRSLLSEALFQSVVAALELSGCFLGRYLCLEFTKCGMAFLKGFKLGR